MSARSSSRPLGKGPRAAGPSGFGASVLMRGFLSFRPPEMTQNVCQGRPIPDRVGEGKVAPGANPGLDQDHVLEVPVEDVEGSADESHANAPAADQASGHAFGYTFEDPPDTGG